MTTSGGRERGTRAERERARLYTVRLSFHDGLIRRRRRDNLLFGIIGGLVILGIAGLQTAYYVAGPGVPAPVESPAPSATVPAEDAPAPTEPVPTDAPVPTEVPDPAATPTTAP
nr:dioxygenase [Microbacterium lemovicicum]